MFGEQEYSEGNRWLSVMSLVDTKVTTMETMFANCGYMELTSLDLGSKFNTESVTNMRSMFYACGYDAMTSLDLGNKFYTSKVTDMSSMFWNANSFNQDISNWNINDKTDTKYMFEAAKNFSSKYKPKKLRMS